jgi:hypothetical protein
LGGCPKSYYRYYRKLGLAGWQHQGTIPSAPVERCFRNLPQAGGVWHSSPKLMSHFPQTNANQRSPRVQLNGSIAAAVLDEGGQKARAKLQTISISGGLLQLQQALSAGDFVEIAFHTRSGPVHGMAEMLRPVRKAQSACLQPFRFIALGDDDHRKLTMALQSALDRFLDSVSEQAQPPAGF